MPVDLQSFLWSVLGVGGGAAAVAYFLFKKLGESWLDAKFSERLEAFRHEKAAELERLRAEIDGSLRAKVRHQEREFTVLSDCWDLMNVAFGATQSYISPFQQYQDIGRMSADMRREYLGRIEMLESQRNEILSSSDPTKEFVQVYKLIKNNAANNAIAEFNNCVYRNEIFIDFEIAEYFKSIIKSLRSAVMNKELSSELKEHKLGTEAWQEIENVIHPKILEITSKLRSRIGSYGSNHP